MVVIGVRAQEMAADDHVGDLCESMMTTLNMEDEALDDGMEAMIEEDVGHDAIAAVATEVTTAAAATTTMRRTLAVGEDGEAAAKLGSHERRMTRRRDSDRCH